MRRTQHMAIKAFEQLLTGVIPEKCDQDELEALEVCLRAMPKATLEWLSDTVIRSELEDRERVRTESALKDWGQAIEELTPDGKFRLEGEVF